MTADASEDPRAEDSCQCDHESHRARRGHDYLDPHTPAGRYTAIDVGPICDVCARTHMAHRLNVPLPGLEYT